MPSFLIGHLPIKITAYTEQKKEKKQKPDFVRVFSNPCLQKNTGNTDQ